MHALLLAALLSFPALGEDKAPDPAKPSETKPSSSKPADRPAEKSTTKSAPRPPTDSGEGLSAEQLERLNAIIAERDSKGSVPMEDNVLIRVVRYESVMESKTVRDLQEDLQTRQIKVQTRALHPAQNGLQATYVYGNPVGRFSSQLGSEVESKLGAQAHEVSLMTQIGKKSYVSILTKSSEVWDTTIRPAPIGGVAQEPILIENVVGTGLEVLVKAASKHVVILKVTPYFRTRQDAGPRERVARTLVEELETTVWARPGEAVVLGGLATRSTDTAASLFSNRTQGGTRSSMIVLTATPHFMMRGLPPDEREPVKAKERSARAEDELDGTDER